MNLTFSMFLLEKQLIFNINILDYFKYLYIDFKKMSYFYKKIISIFLSKYDQKKSRGLDF